MNTHFKLPVLTVQNPREVERLTTWLCVLGGALGALGALTASSFLSWAPWFAVGTVLLVNPRAEDGQGPAVVWTTRLGMALALAALVAVLPTHPAVTLSCFALAGMMLAGPGAGRKAVGGIAAVASVALCFAATSAAVRWWPGLLRSAWPLAQGLSVALFLGLSRVAAELRWHRSRLSARLGEANDWRLARAQRALDRVSLALRRAPRQAAREVLERHADRLVAEALQQSASLEALGAQLLSVDRTAIKKEHGALAEQAAAAPDSQTRLRLLRAAGQVSDLLEQLDGLEVRRGRLDAQLQVQVTSLERLALALEFTPPHGTELSALAARFIDEPGAGHLEPVPSAAH